MDQNKIKSYVNSLKKISYLDWIKLRIIIDRSFELDKKELENKLQLNEEMVDSILQQFEWTLD